MVRNVYNLSTWFFNIIFSTWSSVQKSPSIKKIEKVVWETLNEAQNVNEKRAWGDQVAVGESIDEELHTPARNLMKDNTIFTP
jgi:hypothetical protein